jgi:hypothetical protein
MGGDGVTVALIGTPEVEQSDSPSWMHLDDSVHVACNGNSLTK